MRWREDKKGDRLLNIMSSIYRDFLVPGTVLLLFMCRSTLPFVRVEDE
ncbi:hypothetical protein KDAU_46810 [Dictyobacter aurantiacus]|uniref:Uncharacterized protein n=1 Tax=Dictyobacter aurantiacus TaxID=1936993 RepID=A0A401ZKJ5_9CHLR|nr:hypothetical protein KDAU_46810 [Dictyobacter aurantiacus]